MAELNRREFVKLCAVASMGLVIGIPVSARAPAGASELHPLIRIGNDGRVNLTPMWFDYEGDTVLVNVATHRKKVEWIRKNPELSILIVNPQNMYHWISIKCHVEREILEDDPAEGAKVTAQLDKIWTKYTGNEPPYGLRDPSIDERRVLFVCPIDRIATFGRP